MFEDTHFPTQTPKEQDQVAAERGDLAALIRFQYRREAVPQLKVLESWGMKLKYLPIADMCMRQNNLTDAEYFLQKAAQNKEENTTYKYALFWEQAGNQEKAIEKLMEVYRNPQDKCYLSACQRLSSKYKMKIEIPQELKQSEAKLNGIIWYLALIIAVLVLLFAKFLIAIPSGFVIYLLIKNRPKKKKPVKKMFEWEDLWSPYADYCNELGQEYKDDPDLGPVKIGKAENEPQQNDFERPVFLYGQNFTERDNLTGKIHHIRMHHLIQRYYRGEKWLMPILVIMYHLKFDGEKFIGNASGQNEIPVTSYDMTRSTTLKFADQPLQGEAFYFDQL